MPTNNKVEIEFMVKDEVSKALQNIKKNLQNAAEEAKKGSKPVFDLGTILSSAVGFSAASMIGNTAQAFKEFVAESIRSSILFEQQLIALEFQTNKTADALLDNLSVAVEGTVSRLNLASAANRALALGIQQDDLAGLFGAASARAKIMGISVQQAVDNIATGIGRASPMILDNLGIVFDLDKTYKDYAATLGTTVEALTKLDKTRALTLATIESTRVAEIAMNSAIYSTGTEVERTRTKIEDLKTSMGDNFLKQLGDVMLLFEDINTVSNQLNPALQQNADKIKGLASEYETLQKEQRGLLETQKSLRGELETISGQKLESEVQAEREINRLNLERVNIEQQLNNFKPTSGNAQADYEKLKSDLAHINAQLSEQNLIVEKGALERKVARDTAIGGAESIGKLEKEGTTLDMIKNALQERIDKQSEYNDRLTELTTIILPSYASQIDVIDQANERIMKNTERIANNYSTIERELTKISILLGGGSLSYT